LAALVLSENSLVQPLLEAREQSRGSTSNMGFEYLDLKDLGASLTRSNDSRLHAPGQAIMTGIDQAVIGAYGNDPYSWSGGLTIMMKYEDNASALAAYVNGTWAKATRWDDLLLWLAEEKPILTE
jgi:hypothetical protein